MINPCPAAALRAAELLLVVLRVVEHPRRAVCLAARAVQLRVAREEKASSFCLKTAGRASLLSVS